MNITLESVLWVGYLGVIVTLGGYGLFNFALSRVEASKAAVYVNLIPVFAVILAFIFLGERLTFEQLVASGIILSGVFISQLPTQKLKKIRLRRR